MKITKEFIKRASTSSKTLSLTTEQFKLLGVIGKDDRYSDVERGWTSRLVGTEIPDDVAERVLDVGRRRRSKRPKESLGRSFGERVKEVTAFRLAA